MSQALVDDLARVATGARQHAAVNDPDLILALLAFQVSGGVKYDNPIGLNASDVPNWPTTEASGYALDERLTTPTEWTVTPLTAIWPRSSASSARRVTTTFRLS